MKATVSEGDRLWTADLAAPLDISIELNPHSNEQPQAFFLPPARALAVEVGPFVGDTRRGGSCNCEMVTLYPHGNGTHTECVGHVTRERIGVQSLLRDVFLPATLLTVHPQSFAESGETYPAPHAADELAVTRASIERAVDSLGRALGGVEAGFLQALILRTAPNCAAKRRRSYSGAGTAYLTEEAMAWIRERGTEHLLVDLPSIDREDDGGLLPLHCAFWDVPPDRSLGTASASRRSITEMVYVDDRIADGLYLVNLQIPPLALDAVPSRPLLFPVALDRAR
jgi:arylformamidase